MAEAPERLGKLEWRMDRVEEGVSNFRQFQVDARSFFDRADERARTEEAFHNRRDQEIKDAFNLRHQENVDKLSEISAGISKKTLIWNIAGVFVGIAALIISVLGIMFAVKMTHTSDLQQLFLHSRSVPVLSLMHQAPQESRIPPMRGQ